MLREKPGEPEHIELDRGKQLFYLNLAQCQLNMGQHYEAIQTTTKVLEQDPNNLVSKTRSVNYSRPVQKGLFRRSKAYTATWELEKAAADLNQIIAAHPDSTKMATDELENIAKLHNKKENDDKNVYSKMFQ